MKLALVHDAPRPSATVSAAYLDRVVAACAAAAGEEVETREFFAVSVPQPGGKAPPVADVRKEYQRLYGELAAWDPQSVLTLGASAMNSLLAQPRVRPISKERGRMRWLVDGRVTWTPTISPFSVVKSPDLHRDLARDVYKAISQRAPMAPMRVETTVANTLDGLVAALTDLDGATVVAVDVETTGLSSHRDALLAVGFGAVASAEEGVAVVLPRILLEDSHVNDALWEGVWRRTRRTVGHNFKFDMQFLRSRIGWAPDGALIGDTLLLSYLLDERPNRPTSRIRGLGLKEQVATRYDFEYGFDFDAWTKEPEESRDYDSLHAYLGFDVCYTALLWHDLAAEADEESPRLIECHDQTLMPAARTIARAETVGAPVDVPWIEATIAMLDRRIDRRKTVCQRAIAWLAKTPLDNIMAPAQVADIMYDEWKMTPDVRKNGVVPWDDHSTDRDHLKAAIAKYLGGPQDRNARWLRSLERLRRDDKVRTTYQKSLLDRVDDDGRVRASFLLHGTSTGRLSSREPNLQNVPSLDRVDSDKHRPMRRAFRPAPGRLWVEADYSQLELRVAAGLSGDRAFGDVFRSGRDVHLEVATAIFSRPAEQISKAQRFLAKSIAFGILYGRGAKALATGAEMRYAEQELGMRAWTVEEAKTFIERFLRSYPTLSAWIDSTHEEVLAQGYVESAFGRRRRFPLIPRSKGEVASIERQAVNTPVQSAASDICLRAMTRVQKGIDWHELDAAVLFPVHDSICLEVGASDVEPLRKLCVREMHEDFMGVPLTVDFEYGVTWADLG